jgi:hypothetical protein
MARVSGGRVVSDHEITRLRAALAAAERRERALRGALLAEQEKYDHIEACTICGDSEAWCTDALGQQIHADDLRRKALADTVEAEPSDDQPPQTVRACGRCYPICEHWTEPLAEQTEGVS